MQVIFTKHKNCDYSIVVTGRDRVKLQFQGVGKKFLISHDLSHFIVESKLNLHQGFWGCVANGALFPGMNIIEGRQKAHAKSKSKQVIKEAHQQLRLAECFVRLFDEITTAELELFPGIAKKYLSQISSDIKPQELPNSTILDVCSVLRTFQTDWQAMNIEEHIKLHWNRKFPDKSLNVS
ncbi:conserved hypothetical protein [Hyella patelloides LEGE 07179]|uniref:Uncharacterized protein n=1 Tax=Hyella patelloides LEGE 07179 TaxID=945734 RepID=A0A563VLX8_9CYAN|nr:hypothetical protein [Hyella patelloides]VEP12456.1 conserved hypothetical protein [Hyella patelloides LEGE 07179]